MKLKFLSILFVASAFFIGCDNNTLFETEYKYAFFCEQAGNGQLQCKETANPDIRYTHDEQQSMLLQMDIQQKSLAQVGRLKEGFALVFAHFALGAPITVRISETSGIPLLGGWQHLFVRSAMGDFSETVSDTRDFGDATSYVIRKKIEGITFNYAMMVPKNKSKNNYLIFLMENADAIIVYGNNSDAGERAIEYLNSKLK